VRRPHLPELLEHRLLILRGDADIGVRDGLLLARSEVMPETLFSPVLETAKPSSDKCFRNGRGFDNPDILQPKAGSVTWKVSPCWGFEDPMPYAGLIEETSGRVACRPGPAN